MLNSRVALFISRVANFNSRVAISKKEDHPGRPTRQTRPTLSPALLDIFLSPCHLPICSWQIIIHAVNRLFRSDNLITKSN